ncbi:zinc finger CCCH domain-containing protein 3 [Aplochiton taeniatus]
MDENDALKRQIELLQNLINNHKSVHGNAPSTSADQWRPARTASAGSRGRNTPLSQPHRPQVSLPDRHWKKTYSLSNRTQQFTSSLRQSKFTWVKSHGKDGAGTSQTRAEPQTPSSSAPIPACPAWSPGNASTPLSTKRALNKKVPRRLISKTSKYTWVSSSAGGQTKLSRKPLSPKALPLIQRTLEKGEAVKKPRTSPSPSAKHRKGAGASALSSRYRWKAGGQSGSGAVAGTAVLRRRSAFHWTPEVDKGPKKEKGWPSLLSVSQPSSSPGGFKLRSSMKIIRRCASSGVVSERRTSPPSLTVSSRYSLCRRSHPPTRTHTQSKSPGAAKKTQPRELVAFGRHKLRRLSLNSHRTGQASPSQRGPASPRVFRTRYKMVTRLAGAAAHTPHYGGPLSWRAKRIQSARNVLQGRLRAPHDRHPPTQHWRGRDMRWIGGSLYRVSANKLSRTVAASTSINRTGKWFGPHEVSPTASPSLARPSSTRHVASRAVQRSLAIIRHARQKKPQKQYCMYYNRFGKCNRGDSCPYAHDPDKVAVCTRFLRGTCKQTDGTCPFSHKVAKEKMPVCSYFLRGICNNSSCPYSHVYVSRKAAVCQDFLKGYCPQGEKCKKKHTLVCPDFSASGTCPRGSLCKLRHRQRAKRAAPHPSPSPSSSSSSSQAKRGHRPKRPRLSVVMPSEEQAEGSQADPGTPVSGPLKLPSFISLSSSPEDADAPDTPPAPAEVTERKLQIKPRL